MLSDEFCLHPLAIEDAVHNTSAPSSTATRYLFLNAYGAHSTTAHR